MCVSGHVAFFQCLHLSPTLSLWWRCFSNTQRAWFGMASWQMLRNFAVCSVILLSAGYQTVPSPHLAHLVHLAQQASPSPYALPWPQKPPGFCPSSTIVCISLGTPNPQFVTSTCAQAKGRLIIRWYFSRQHLHNMAQSFISGWCKDIAQTFGRISEQQTLDDGMPWLLAPILAFLGSGVIIFSFMKKRKHNRHS